MGRRAVPVAEAQAGGGWGREEIREWAGVTTEDQAGGAENSESS